MLRNNPSTSACVQVLKLKIIDLEDNVNVLKNDLEEMEQPTRRKVTIIEKEKDLMEEIMIEEDSSQVSCLLR